MSKIILFTREACISGVIYDFDFIHKDARYNGGVCTYFNSSCTYVLDVLSRDRVCARALLQLDVSAAKLYSLSLFLSRE